MLEIISSQQQSRDTRRGRCAEKKIDPISIVILSICTMLLGSVLILIVADPGNNRLWWIPFVEAALSLGAILCAIWGANKLALATIMLFLLTFWTTYFTVGLPSMLKSEPVDPILISFSVLFGLAYVFVAVRLIFLIRKTPLAK